MWHSCLRSSRWWPVRPYCRVRRWQVWFLLSTDRRQRPNSCGTPLKRWRRYRGLTPRLREHRRVLFCPRKRIISMKCYLESVSEAHLWLWLQLQSCWKRRLFGWNGWRPHTGRSHCVLMWVWQGYRPLFRGRLSYVSLMEITGDNYYALLTFIHTLHYTPATRNRKYSSHAALPSTCSTSTPQRPPGSLLPTTTHTMEVTINDTQQQQQSEWDCAHLLIMSSPSDR